MGTVQFKTQAELEQEALESWRASAKVSALQARIALARFGLLKRVQELVATVPDSELAIAWEYAVEFSYNSPFLNEVSEALELSQDEKDALFRTAESIDV